VLVVRWWWRWWQLGVLHPIVGCVLCVGWSPLVEYRNTTIQSEPFIRSKQDGCSDKTEHIGFGGFSPHFTIPRFLYPTGWWIY
jgi:hypothetical protein